MENIFLFPIIQEVSKELISELETQLIKEFGFDFEYSEFFISQEEHFQKLSLVRKKLYNSQRWYEGELRKHIAFISILILYLFSCAETVQMVKEKAESEEGKKLIETVKEKAQDKETQDKLKGLLGNKKEKKAHLLPPNPQ